MRKLKKYKPTAFKAKDSVYDKDAADYAVNFIECLCHTKGTWAGRPFELIDWQEQIIRDLFGILKPNGYRQFNTAYVEIPKKMGKSELAAAIALLLTCGDGEERAEVYGCAADRQQATIVFDVAADMVRMCPALNKRVKILASQKESYFVKFNVDGLLRGDYQSRMNGYATARQNGWMSANDIRELENLDRIPAELGGDLYLINGNMTKLQDAGIFAGKEENEGEEILELDESGSNGDGTGTADSHAERNHRRGKLV